MQPIRVLILGHSSIRRVHDLLCCNFNAHIAKKLSLDGDLLIGWHRIRGRTVSKTREYDLGVVEEFTPNVVIMQLGTNDLTTISAVETGSAIEDLCCLLYESCPMHSVSVITRVFSWNLAFFYTVTAVLFIVFCPLVFSISYVATLGLLGYIYLELPLPSAK